MSTFEPDHVLALVKLVNGGTREEQKEFEQKWRDRVEKRWKAWQSRRTSQSQYVSQLEWESHIVEYVSWAYNSAKSKSGLAPVRAEFPLLGPRFLPPTYWHNQRRRSVPEIHPETAYMKALTVIHPLYFDSLAKCPRCDATGDEVSWGGWTTTGHCEVHGLDREETALGYQLRCKRCAGSETESSKNGEGTHCFATTNHVFWKRREHWEVPAGVPFFTKRCALTRDLFNLVVEFRPSMTSAGMAEHIRQLHLRRYHQERLAYLSTFEAQFINSKRSVVSIARVPLRRFSKPDDLGGYCDISITDDMISDIYLKFSKSTRVEESNEYLRTLTAVTISIDQTFRAAGKAKMVTASHKHEKRWGGGILSALNERGQTLAWQFCQTQANAEITELLQGLKRRFSLLSVPEPDIVVADNCCHVRKAIKNAFPNAHVALDVWHLLRRYSACILGGAGSPSRSDISNDIVSAILKTRADKFNPAVYWPLEEQVKRLDQAFKKWAAQGAWNAAAAKTHQEQMKHVRKGCLTRPRNDVRSDGSRIEGSHKGWNGLQRSHASGLEMLTMLSHDFVLRRNHRLDLQSDTPTPFSLSTYGSHHIRLINHTARLWNSLLRASDAKHERLFAGLQETPVFQSVDTREAFGIVQSQFAAGYQYLLDVKTEETEDDIDFLGLSSQAQDFSRRLLASMNLDPVLLSRPLAMPIASMDGDVSMPPSLRYALDDSGAAAPTDAVTAKDVKTPKRAGLGEISNEVSTPSPASGDTPNAASFAPSPEVRFQPLKRKTPPSDDVPGMYVIDQEHQHTSKKVKATGGSLVEGPSASSTVGTATQASDRLLQEEAGEHKISVAMCALAIARGPASTDDVRDVSPAHTTTTSTRVVVAATHTVESPCEGQDASPTWTRIAESPCSGQAQVVSVPQVDQQTPCTEAASAPPPTVHASATQRATSSRAPATLSSRTSRTPSSPGPTASSSRAQAASSSRAQAASSSRAPTASSSRAPTASFSRTPTSPSTPAPTAPSPPALTASSSRTPGATAKSPLTTSAAAHTSSRETTALTSRNSDIKNFFGARDTPASSSRPASYGSKLPKVEITGLTPSQRLFSIATGLNPLSLAVSSGDEFFLFMDLRAEHKWVSHRMTPQKWVEAAALYNTELEKLGRRLGRFRGDWTAWKTPRALMDKLGEVEPMVVRRLATGDYVSKESGREEFWRKHCHAVPLMTGAQDYGKKRKINTCTRCKAIMWPGPKGSSANHKRSCCSDGVRMNAQASKKTPSGETLTFTEELPPWPQPAGIFEEGKKFNPTIFLSAVSQLYQQMVLHRSTGEEYAMEYLAFAEMLHKRTIVVETGSSEPATSSRGEAASIGSDDHADGRTPVSPEASGQQILFRLFDSLALGPCPPQMLVTYNGLQYLSITPLLAERDVGEEEEEGEEE